MLSEYDTLACFERLDNGPVGFPVRLLLSNIRVNKYRDEWRVSYDLEPRSKFLTRYNLMTSIRTLQSSVTTSIAPELLGSSRFGLKSVVLELPAAKKKPRTSRV